MLFGLQSVQRSVVQPKFQRETTMNTISAAPYKLLTTFTFREDAIKTTQTANEFGAPRKHEVR